MNENGTDKSSAIPGIAAFGSFIVAAGSVLMAINAAKADQFTGGGICMIAAALSLGLLANAVYRN